MSVQSSSAELILRLNVTADFKASIAPKHFHRKEIVFGERQTIAVYQTYQCPK